MRWLQEAGLDPLLLLLLATKCDLLHLDLIVLLFFTGDWRLNLHLAWCVIRAILLVLIGVEVGLCRVELAWLIYIVKLFILFMLSIHDLVLLHRRIRRNRHVRDCMRRQGLLTLVGLYLELRGLLMRLFFVTKLFHSLQHVIVSKILSAVIELRTDAYH